VLRNQFDEWTEKQKIELLKMLELVKTSLASKGIFDPVELQKYLE
jgi:hypothetical protein